MKRYPNLTPRLIAGAALVGCVGLAVSTVLAGSPQADTPPAIDVNGTSDDIAADSTPSTVEGTGPQPAAIAGLDPAPAVPTVPAATAGVDLPEQSTFPSSSAPRGGTSNPPASAPTVPVTSDDSDDDSGEDSADDSTEESDDDADDSADEDDDDAHDDDGDDD